MLAPGSQKPAGMTSDGRLLRLNQAEQLGVEAGRSVDVVDEERDRADARDLEGSAEQDAADVVGGVPCFRRSISRLQVDALGDRLLDLIVLRHLRQGRPLPEASIVHNVWPGSALPADLVDAIVEIVLLSV